MIDPIRAEEVAVPVFITQEAQQFAQQFARQQPDPTRARQVHLNTLAVCAVKNYLRILDIPADPSNCDSWNPLMRLTTNVADLEIVGKGRIECRPVSPAAPDAELACYVPTEVQGDRLAYIVVQIEANHPRALILGFADQVEGEKLPLDRLRPMSELPTYLDQHAPRPVSERVTQLTRWLQGQVETGWKALDEVLGTTALQYQWASVRSAPGISTTPVPSRIVRGKVLEIETSQGIQTVVLLAELIPKADSDLGVELKILPPDEQMFLPAGLSMTIVDAAGDAVMHAQARDENRMIDLGFHAESCDRFTLRIEIEEVTIDERFVV